jgi:hypothetical protein
MRNHTHENDAAHRDGGPDASGRHAWTTPRITQNPGVTVRPETVVSQTLSLSGTAAARTSPRP